jgi:hypothetical protein
VKVKIMNPRIRYALVASLTAFTACHHTPPFHVAAGPNWIPDPPHANVLTAEEANGNGIEVGEPKVYDDASLRMMLDGIRAKLAGISGLDQASLIAALGNVSGATISQSQFALQVSSGALPTVATTNTGPTSSMTTNNNLPAGNTALPGSTTVATQPTTQTVTTTNPPASSIPTVPTTLAFTPPTSVAPSSLDLLNQQMQLSYEMTSLQLLLEGALSDRFAKGTHFVKPRVTLGFPISLRPPLASRDAAAVVEVEVQTTEPLLAGELPSITALLPQEKTYNVAAMTDRTTSIGAGVVLGMIGVGGSYLHGRKTLYLVQDQDTVAFERPPANQRSVSFSWEFHPVMGEHFVRGGMKQTFVQIALPLLETIPCLGTVRIRTYWRSFDQHSGRAGAVEASSVLASLQTFPIPNFDLTPAVGNVSYEDLGDGTVLVTVKPASGRFLAGTYVQLGTTRYDPGKNLVFEDAALKFVAPITAVARWTGHVVARSGAQADLLNPVAQDPIPGVGAGACPSARPAVPSPPPPESSPCGEYRILATAEPFDASSTTVRVQVTTTTLASAFYDQLLLVIGGKVFGLRDAIVKRDNSVPHRPVITALVPTALLVSDPLVRVFRPFYSRAEPNPRNCFDATTELTGFGQDSATERLVLVAVAANGDATYILYGNGLDHATVLSPAGLTLTQLDHIGLARIRSLAIPKATLATAKKLVLQKSDGERPLVIDIPDPKATPPKAIVDSPVVQNTDQLEVKVDNAAQIASVKLGDKALRWEPVKDDDSAIRLLNLKADGVTNEQKSREITIEYKDGTKVTLKFEVVAARIGVR